MDKTNEAGLLNRAKAFDTQALAVIYDRYSPALYAYAMRLLGDECLAEDCVAETFARFLKALQAGRGPDEYLQAYLYRIAHNWIVDVYHHQPPPPFELDENIREDDEILPEKQLSLRMEQERVRGALRMLTPDQRQVIVLRYIEGWDNVEVAEAVQKPVGAVKALQHRALASLRRWLLGEGREETYEK